MVNYPRTNYEMTEADLEAMLDACKPVPYMVMGGHAPSSPQENANRAWARLGEKMGFDPMTVQPVQGKGSRFFSAIPSETETQRTERLAQEAETRRLEEISTLAAEIADRQKRMDALLRVGTKRSSPYGEMCRDPDACAGKGYCPRDPTCGD